MTPGREAARERASRTPARQGPTETLPAPANETGGQATMRQLLEQMKPELALALPKHMTPERMARQALTAFRTIPKLGECTPASFLGALMTCAQLGLEPGPQGHVWLIPFRNKGVMEATFILGYQGMIELARRSGELEDIAARTVYQNEVDGLHGGQFEVHYGTSGRIVHKPIVFGERGEPVGYYAMAKLKSGATPFVVLSKADVEVFRRRSATQRDNPSGPWSTDYEPMAWKTCIRRLSRWLPQSPELAAAVAHEETARDYVAGEVVDNVLELQPPAVEDEPDDMGADPETGEIPAGHGQADAEPDPPAEYGDDVPPDPNDGSDPWAGAK